METSNTTSVFFSYFFSFEDIEIRKEKASLFVDFLQSKHFLRIISSLSSVQNILDELFLIIDNMNGVYMNFYRHHTVENLILSIKNYYISWNTLSDLIGILINSIFDFGFLSKHIKFEMIMTNSHVNKTNLPLIYQKYTKQLNVSKMKFDRNTIVHNGILDDSIINNILSKREEIWKNHLFVIPANKSEDDIYLSRMDELDKEIQQYGNDRHLFWEKHFNKTIEFIKELVLELAIISRKKYLNF